MTDLPTGTARAATAAGGGLPHGPGGAPVHKRMALVVIAMSQLMVVLDATIVNVALKDIRDALGFRSDSDLSWVVTGYTLTFGGFLLLGGKLADRLGRRRIFITGAVLFAAASFAGGIADSQSLLIAARLVQGLGGALMSPAALSLLTVDLRGGSGAQPRARRLLRDHRRRRGAGPHPRRRPDRLPVLALGALRQRPRSRRWRSWAPCASCRRAATRRRAASTCPAPSSSPVA